MDCSIQALTRDENADSETATDLGRPDWSGTIVTVIGPKHRPVYPMVQIAESADPENTRLVLKWMEPEQILTSRNTAIPPSVTLTWRIPSYDSIGKAPKRF